MGIIVQLQATKVQRTRRAPRAVAVAERLAALGRGGVNAPLHCLAGGTLVSRFRAWRGGSGRRYVCSVFPASADSPLGGLPEFNAAVAIAVRSDANGKRSRVAVFELCWRDGRFEGDSQCVQEALDAGISEWHVHLLATTSQSRQAAISDLKQL